MPPRTGSCSRRSISSATARSSTSANSSRNASALTLPLSTSRARSAARRRISRSTSAMNGLLWWQGVAADSVDEVGVRGHASGGAYLRRDLPTMVVPVQQHVLQDIGDAAGPALALRVAIAHRPRNLRGTQLREVLEPH